MGSTPQASAWDPLETGATLSEELIGATIKRQIKNILKSYTGWYDPLSELIQNSLDAVDNRRMENEEGYVPKIWIGIDLKENVVCVTDNGTGFKEEEFKNFLAPNVSFKKGKTRGNKGVGATYLAYGFNFLQLGTKTPDFSFVGTMKGGRQWVEDDSNTRTRPIIRSDSALDGHFNEIDRGSTFVLKFEGEHIRPRNLNWVGANTAEQWGVVLRIKTPLGGVLHDNNLGVVCFLTVVSEDGNISKETLTELEYIYPHKAIPLCKNLSEILSTQRKLNEQGRDSSKLPDRFHRLNGIYETWDTGDILSEKSTLKVKLDETERELIKKYGVSIYSFLCYSTGVWDAYNDDVVKLRKTARILRGGLQLATNNMPQGDLLVIPLTKDIGFQNVTHALAHFDSADPDLGRKGFQPELEELAKRLSVASVSAIKRWRKLLKKETGAPANVIAEKAIYEWVREQEEHERNNPLVINRSDLFLPTKEPSITSEPMNEQDVVALFNQLLAGGVIRGIKVLSTNQRLQYDGICKCCLKRPFENHIFDKESNPLGIESSAAKEEFITIPRILEYKYNFDALLEEMEKGIKAQKDIDLVVAWEIGENWDKRYEVSSLLDFDNLHHRQFHGETHQIKDSMTGDLAFSAIILKELIAYVNDPQGTQGYHKSTYSDMGI